MSLKLSRLLLFFVALFFAFGQPVTFAQSVPCSAITRNPLVLEALLDSRSNDDEDLAVPDGTINVAQLEHLQFSPIVIQPGDALYMEYKGKDFTVDADFPSGETAFESSPQGSYEQWRKGILPLDIFREALNQRLIRLRAAAKNPDQVLLRNIKIIRAGKPVFEFSSLASYGKPHIKRAVEHQLPCVGFDDVPANGNPTAVNYSFPNLATFRNFSGGLTQPMLQPFPMMMMQSTTIGTDANHYKFTGKELDDESGLYNFGARYYSPGIGRYVSPDWSARPVPVPYADLSNPQTLNLYNFGQNNPMSTRDPDGHCPDGVCINIAAKPPAQIDHLAKATPQVMIGQAKALVNTVTSTANIAVNVATHGGTYIPGTTPEIPQLKPTNEAQAAGMITMNGALATTGVVTGGVAIVDLTSTVRAASVIDATSVMHFTSDAGVASITDSGGLLRAGTYVTTPGEIPAGATSTQVENLLEIGPGKGQNSITFETPTSNLTVPENGSTTSGGAQQFQLKQPTQVDPTKFKKPGGGS